MEGSNPPVPLEALLGHRAWVRRVARALVADENAADDLEQEVWLRAVRSPPREARSLRAWLGTVLRHAAADRRRSEEARARREERAALPEGEEPRDLVAEAEVHRMVVDAVLALPEPYRMAVLRRWFEGIEPPESARREGVPVETVRTRLKRAVAMLRERLDAEHGGDRRAWVLLLVPLARRPLPVGAGAAATGAAGVILMGTKIKFAVAAAVLAVAGMGIWWTRGGEPEEGTGTAAALRPPETAPAGARPAPEAAPETEIGATVDPARGGKARIEVQVCDTAGSPVPGASVALFDAPPPPPEGVAGKLHPPSLGRVAARTETDAAGACSIRGVPAGAWLLSVEARGFPRHFEDLRFAEGEEVAGVRVVLLPGCALSGTVRGRDGSPLPGLPVLAARPWEGGDRGFDRVSCVADGTGRYRLEGLAPGVHDLLVLLPTGVLRGGGCVRVPEVSEFDIRLAGGASLRGRVLDDATGSAVAGALVALRVASHSSAEGWDGNRDALAETRSGPDGSFVFADLPPGTLGEFSARAEGYLDFPDPRFDVTPYLRTVFSEGLEVVKDVRLRRGAAIRGIVTGPDGKPVTGARVSFASFWADRFANLSGRHPCGETETGPDGAYRLSAVRPGVGMLDVRAEGLCLPGVTPEAWSRIAEGAKAGNDAVVEVRPAGEVVRDLRLVEAASIEGFCVDGEGRPVAGLRVSLHPTQDADSRAFALAALPGGSQILFAGRPEGDRGISAWLAAAGESAAVTDAAGLLLVESVRPGIRVTVVASGSGGRRGWSDPVETAAGVRSKGVRIAIGNGAALAGRIRRADGRALVRPSLHLVEGMRPRVPYWGLQNLLTRQWAPVVPVAPDGSFRAEGVEPGWWQLEAADEGCAVLLSADLEVKPGETKSGIEIVLHPEMAIEGKATDEEGRPVAGAEVLVAPAEGTPYGEEITIHDADGVVAKIAPKPLVRPLFVIGLEVGASAATGADGRFRQGGLAAGKVRIVIRAAGFAEAVAEAEAGTRDLAVVLRPERTISGRVVEAGTGEPVAGLHVSAAPDPRPSKGWPYRDSTTAEDGSFRIERLAPGKYELYMGRGWSDLDTNCVNKDVQGIEAGTRDLVVEVDRGIPLEGRVVDEEGRPVPWGVKVSAWPQPDAKGERTGYCYEARVEGDGRFRMTTRLGTYEVFAEPETTGFGCAPFLKTSVPGVDAGTRDVVLTLRRGVPIAGRVFYPKDPSIRMWRVEELFVRPSGVEEGLAVRDKGGRPEPVGDRMSFTFTTPPLEPGKAYDVMVPHYSWAGITSGAIARGVLAGATGLVLEIGEGKAVSGVVVDGEGRPAPGVPVFARATRRVTGEPMLSREPGRGAAAYSGPDGSFVLRGLGEYRFRLTTGGENSAFGRMDHPDEVPAGATGVRLVAAAGCSISGTLLDRDGNPAEWLYLEVLGKDGRATHSTMTSKEDGSFTLDGLSPGPVRLAASFRGKQHDLGAFEAPATGLALRLPE